MAAPSNTPTPAQALGERILDAANQMRENGMKFGLRSLHDGADLLIDVRREILEHGQNFAGLEAELRDWQNLLTAVIAPRGLPGVSVEYPKLWPFDGGQDAAMVAFALHAAIERAEAAEARCAELEGGCQMLREEVEGLRAAFLAARG